MNTIEYLNEAKKVLQIDSDYALAKALQIRSSAISNYRSGKSQMDDDVAVKIAAIIGKHAGIVMLDMHREREKNPELRAVWTSVMEKFSVGFNALMTRRTPRPA
jgi:predicted transcriptional regulator